ncbi:MAG: VOC family protein [Magnetovibrio sp.]|nr:VOC family protein [Magnetovibrio sp.]
MIGYVTLGTNDLEKSTAFYDALLAEIGASRVMDEVNHFVAWGVDLSKPCLTVTRPCDEKRATVGNGVMVALVMENTDQVDAFYQKAIDLGATDEGLPGPRGEGSFYSGYFRDLDGNKLNAFCITPS